MPFDRGSISFTIFKLPQKLPENYIELFSSKSAGILDEVAEEPQVGWVTGRHLLDNDINEDSAMCGGHLYLNLRKAERKIPGALLNAICKREELIWMAANNADRIPRKVKKEIKEEQIEKYLMKMPPYISGLPFVVDLAADILYLGTASQNQIDDFVIFFKQTVGIEPVQLHFEEQLNIHFQMKSYELPELQLTEKVVDDETIPARDFLTWLWFFAETTGGKLDNSRFSDFELMVAGPMTLAFFMSAQGATETTVKKGLPEKSVEAKAALSSGKKLRKASVTIARGEDVWTTTFDADKFAFTGLRLPDGEAMEEHSKFDERIQNLYVFQEVFFEYFKEYVKFVTADDWEEKEKELKRWATERESF